MDERSAKKIEVEQWVAEAVTKVQVVDVHTHLFPPSHGQLMRYGVDELLTYHYLVAELFTVISPKEMTPNEFFNLSTVQQADLVWKELFLKRTPISEATRGVITTLRKLGLDHLIAKRDLVAIRQHFAKLDPAKYVEKVFQLAQVKYCVMTNIPFDPIESANWDYPEAKAYSKWFKAALRIDPILKGDWDTLQRSLRDQGFLPTVEGAKLFLKTWVKKIDAIYLMASTPAGFRYLPNLKSTYENLNQLEYLESGSPHEVSTELIDKIMIPVAAEESLPLALKLGAVRGANIKLDPCGGGDALETADLSFLRNLCSQYSKLKILVTVLSRSNQHELTVLANKFGNLHVYGCWWYCNVPSIIEETTRVRLEVLGTAFTAQHSDARVLDQLVYKWDHSKAVISKVLIEKYIQLLEAGWHITREEVDRDVERLFGGSFHEFMEK